MEEGYRIRYRVSSTPSYEVANIICSREEQFCMNLAFNLGKNDGKLFDDKINDPLIQQDHLKFEANYANKQINISANKAAGFFANINDKCVDILGTSILLGTTTFTFQIKDNTIFIKAAYEKGGFQEFKVPITSSKFSFDIGTEGKVALKYDVWMNKSNTIISYDNGKLTAFDNKSKNGTWLWVTSLKIFCSMDEIFMIGKKFISIQIYKVNQIFNTVGTTETFKTN
jgi:hypothetical protein